MNFPRLSHILLSEFVTVWRRVSLIAAGVLVVCLGNDVRGATFIHAYFGQDDIGGVAGDFLGNGSAPKYIAIKSDGAARYYNWRVSGSPTNIAPFPLITPGGSIGFRAMDVNGDGRDDIIVHGAQGFGPIWLENRMAQQQGFVLRQYSNPSGAGAVASGVADLFGTGKDGALFALADGSVEWHGIAPGATYFQRVEIAPPGPSEVRFVEGADLTGDGRAEIVTFEFNYDVSTIAIWTWTGETDPVSGHPTFDRVAHQFFFQSTRQPAALRLGDINGNGKIDIMAAVLNTHLLTTDIWFFENRLAQSDSLVVHPVGSSNSIGADLVDIDGDGDLDIVTGARAGSSVHWYRNQIAQGSVQFTRHEFPIGVQYGDRVSAIDFKDDIGAHFVTYGPNRPTTWHYHSVPAARNTSTYVDYGMLGAAILSSGAGDVIVARGSELEDGDVLLPAHGVRLHSRSRVDQPAGAKMEIGGPSRLRIGNGHALTVSSQLTVLADADANIEAAHVVAEPTANFDVRANAKVTFKTPLASLAGASVIRQGARATFGGDVELGIAGESGPGSFMQLLQDSRLFVDGETVSHNMLLLLPGSEAMTQRLVAMGHFGMWNARVHGSIEINDTLYSLGENRTFGDVVNNGSIRVESGRLVLGSGAYTGPGTISLGVPPSGSPNPTIFFGSDFSPDPDALIYSEDPDFELSFGRSADFTATDPTLFRTRGMTLRAGGDLPRTFECISRDYGRNVRILDEVRPDVFPIRRLIVGPPPLANGNPAPAATRMVLVDNRDNTLNNQATPEVLYVDELVLQSNGEIRTEGHRIYYRTFINHGGIIDHPDNLIQLTSCPADLTGDGAVGSADLATLLASWGPGGGPADLNGDGSVGSADLATLLATWGPCGG